MATLRTNLPYGSQPMGKVSAQSVAVVELNSLTADLVVPAGFDYRILYGAVSLVSSATVGTRQLELKVRSAIPIEEMSIGAGVTQSVSVTRKYNFMPGVALSTAFTNTDEAFVPIPGELYLPTGYTLRAEIVSGGDVVADDLVMRFMVEQIQV